MDAGIALHGVEDLRRIGKEGIRVVAEKNRAGGQLLTENRPGILFAKHERTGAAFLHLGSITRVGEKTEVLFVRIPGRHKAVDLHVGSGNAHGKAALRQRPDFFNQFGEADRLIL